jgi:hypothetical protein
MISRRMRYPRRLSPPSISHLPDPRKRGLTVVRADSSKFPHPTAIAVVINIGMLELESH